MAHIRSTMDMVMERAAKLCEQSASNSSDDLTHDGMRAGAAFLRGEVNDLANEINKISQAGRLSFTKGLMETFMRNIILPRDAEPVKEEPLQGLMAIPCPDPKKLSGMIREMHSIVMRYSDHRKQLRQQLEENFSLQMAQLEQNLAQQTGSRMKLNPSQHPKFAEEWQNVTSTLDEQYNNAINQYKNAITELLLS